MSHQSSFPNFPNVFSGPDLEIGITHEDQTICVGTYHSHIRWNHVWSSESFCVPISSSLKVVLSARARTLQEASLQYILSCELQNVFRTVAIFTVYQICISLPFYFGIACSTLYQHVFVNGMSHVWCRHEWRWRVPTRPNPDWKKVYDSDSGRLWRHLIRWFRWYDSNDPPKQSGDSGLLVCHVEILKAEEIDEVVPRGVEFWIQ